MGKGVVLTMLALGKVPNLLKCELDVYEAGDTTAETTPVKRNMGAHNAIVAIPQNYARVSKGTKVRIWIGLGIRYIVANQVFLAEELKCSVI